MEHALKSDLISVCFSKSGVLSAVAVAVAVAVGSAADFSWSDVAVVKCRSLYDCETNIASCCSDRPVKGCGCPKTISHPHTPNKKKKDKKKLFLAVRKVPTQNYFIKINAPSQFLFFFFCFGSPPPITGLSEQQ